MLFKNEEEPVLASLVERCLNTNLQERSQIETDWSIKLNKFNNTNFFKVPHTSLFIKKNLLNKIKNYSTNYKISSDLDFLIKLSKLRSNFYYFNFNTDY